MTRSLLALIAAVTITGCGGGDEAVDSVAPPPGYATAKQRWVSAGTQSYRFTISTFYFCVPEGPIAVVVRNGAVQGATYVDTGEPVGTARLSRLPTISGLFAIADEAYAMQAAEVRFTGSAAYGYPEDLYIDYDRRIADEEIGYKVTSFTRDDG